MAALDSGVIVIIVIFPRRDTPGALILFQHPSSRSYRPQKTAPRTTRMYRCTWKRRISQSVYANDQKDRMGRWSALAWVAEVEVVTVVEQTTATTTTSAS